MITTAKDESLFDVAIRKYGHPSGAYWLLEDNSNLALTQVFNDGELLQDRNDFIKVNVINLEGFIPGKLSDYIIKERQSLFDIVIENQGNIEAVFDIVIENRFDGLTEHIFVNDGLKILQESNTPRVRDFISKYMPIATIEENEKSDGIGFMFLERNFKIK